MKTWVEQFALLVVFDNETKLTNKTNDKMGEMLFKEWTKKILQQIVLEKNSTYSSFLS
jgi:hypothetical protein